MADPTQKSSRPWEVLHTYRRKTPKSAVHPYSHTTNRAYTLKLKSPDLITFAEQVPNAGAECLENPGCAGA